MSKQALIPLMVGLIVGVAALKVGYDYVAKMNKGNGPRGPVEKVVVASKPLPLGTKVTSGDVTVVAMPKNLVPDNVIHETKEVIGQTLKYSVPAKIPVLTTMIGPGVGLEGVVPTGYRAVAVKVDEFTSVGGMLSPGVKVDVLGTFSLRKMGGGSETISKVVLQNVEVRAVGQQFRPDDQPANGNPAKLKPMRSVTLLVKSDQVETLQLAASTGSIRLALRSATDDKPAETKGVTLTQLLPSLQPGGLGANGTSNAFNQLLAMASSKKSSATEAGQPYEVEVISGGNTERILFASADSDQRVDVKTSEKETKEPAGDNTDVTVEDPAHVQAE